MYFVFYFFYLFMLKIKDSQGSDRLDYSIYMANSLYYQSRYLYYYYLYSYYNYIYCFFYLQKYSIHILSDTEAASSASNFTNVVLIGGPTTNSFAKSVQSQFPVTFSGNSFTLGSRTFSAPATGVCK